MFEPLQHDLNEWRSYFWNDTPTDDVLAAEAARASKLGIGPWELHVFESIWYGHGQVLSKELLADRAFGIYASEYPMQTAAAIRRCFAEDWVQFLTRDFLDAMAKELVEEGYLTPSCLIGFYDTQSFGDTTNPVGVISFTRRGASLYLKWLGLGPDSLNSDHLALADNDDGTMTAYGTSVAACESAFDADADRIVEQSDPEAIGRWCDRWWLRFESGYRITVRMREVSDC